MKIFFLLVLSAIIGLSAQSQLSCASKTVVNFSYTGSAQTWTVPAAVTSITIKTTGASGGLASALNNSAGGGATMEATYSVSSGQTVTILVGGAGASGDNEAGGGGSTGVYINGVLKLVAGGGGGEDGISGGNAVTTNNAGNGSPLQVSTNCLFNRHIDNAKGGTGGNGGNEGENCILNFDGGGGGGGLNSQGGGKLAAALPNILTIGGGQGSISGGSGGPAGLLGTLGPGGVAGGWGWSGGGGAVEARSGGGGGYSGGGGASTSGNPGGGGSFSDGTGRTGATYFADGTATTTLQNGTVTICYTAPATAPLTLLSFSGTSQTNYNQLKWKTANEFNVDKFIIEKSADGITFYNAGQQTAVNTFIGNDYSFNDYQINGSAKSFYRLKILDHDGTFEYSPIITINKGEQSVKLSIYPNPATDKLLINSSSPIKKLEVINTAGQVVYTANNVGLTNPVPVKNLSKGIYMLKVYSVSEVIVQKFIKD